MFGDKEFVLPDYYISHGLITDPKGYGRLFDPLPDTVAEIVEIIHGLFIHIFWAERYGITLTDAQKTMVQLRSVVKILEQIEKLDSAHLTKPRAYEKRFIGNCRDFSVFLCSVLRSKGIPARARCGFGRYFTPGKFEDHWICEYWDVAENRWVGVDAQLDELQRKVLGISFDPLDVPSTQFINGPTAWKLCRDGVENPDDFGIFDMHGLWFVRSNFVRDLAAVNKVELLPWDSWGLADKPENALSLEDFALLDKMALLMINNTKEIYSYYQNPILCVPSVIKSYTQAGVREVDLTK